MTPPLCGPVPRSNYALAKAGVAQGNPLSGPDLASQPAISRLENLPDVRSLPRMVQALVDLFCTSSTRSFK